MNATSSIPVRLPVRRPRREGVLPAAALCACLLPACSAAPTTGRAPLDDTTRRAVYDANDRFYTRADLWKPAGPAGEAFDLAPLLVFEREPDRPRAHPTEVYFDASSVEMPGRRYRRWTYTWDDGGRQGLRVTLGADGYPAIYEILRDSSGARLLFVSTSLEHAASAAFGPPEAGRRFAVERSTAETPEVIVPAIFEPGPTPLGPFVYLTAASGDVTSLICRCMPSLVESIVDTGEYRLVPADGRGPRWPADHAGPALDRLLRLPPGLLPDAE